LLRVAAMMAVINRTIPMAMTAKCSMPPA
jgi:hypothetical protein